MLFDTDILIWCQRGSLAAAHLVDRQARRAISAQTYMELIQGAKDKRQITEALGFVRAVGFEVLPITPKICDRAMALLEEHTLSSGLMAPDALIAATALDHHIPLATANAKHFKAVPGLELHVFKPGHP